MKKTKLIVALAALLCLLVSMLAVHTFAADGSVSYGGLALSGGTDDVTGNKFGMDSYQTCKDADVIPVTLEAWVYVPASLEGEALGTLYGNYWTSSKYGMAYINWEIAKNATPKLVWNSSLDGENYDVTFSESQLPTNAWTHLAIVYNGDTGVVSCYVNGTLTEEKYYYPAIDPDVLELPMMIGSDIRTMNTNYFKGEIGDITVYSDVRTADEIGADCSKGMDMTAAEADLSSAICYYDIDSDDIGKNIADESGNGYDIIYSKAWLTEAEMEAIRSASGFKPSYSFAVMGDTQMLADYYPEKMPVLYQWIVDNAAADKKNIKFAIGLGDITNDNGRDDRYEYDEANKVYYKVSTTADGSAPYTQWDVAYDAITLLDGKVHYALVRGNHDVYSGYDGVRLEGFNSHFENSEWFTAQFTAENGGGLYTTGPDPVTGYRVSYANTYQTLTVNNTNYLFLNLDWRITADIVNWAEQVLKAHPDHSVIVSTHSYLNADGTTEDLGDPTPRGSYNGDVLWDILFSKYANVKMILSGHIDSETIVTNQVKGDNGNTVTEVLINPQGFDSKLGGTAMITMFYFNESGDEIFVEWYSPTKDRYYRNLNQFVIDLDADIEKNAESAWDGATTAQPSGSGTEADPYLIATAENLAWISTKITDGGVSFAGKYFKQTADIDLCENVFTSIGSYYISSSNMAAFGGIYDGCGYSIKNGTITGGKLITSTNSPAPERYFNYSEGYGLFGVIYGATIKNIVLDDVQVVGRGATGAIVGRAAAPEITDTALAGFNSIVGCEITDTVKIVTLLPNNGGSAPTSFDDGLRAGRVGSVCGMAYSAYINGCTSAAEFSLSGDFTLAGGIVGTAGLNSRIENCAFLGGMTLAECASGLVSYLGGIVGAVSPSESSADLMGTRLDISGILYIGNCYNSGYFSYIGGEVTSDVYYGGIIGFCGDLADVDDDNITYPYLIENCYNLYEKTKENSALNVAGLVGYATAGEKTLYVKNSYSVAVDAADGESNEYKFAAGSTVIDGLDAIVAENCGTLAKADMSGYVSSIDASIASVKANGVALNWKVGSGAPSGTAAEGLKYLDVASNVYYVYESGAWTAVRNIAITDSSLETEYGTIPNKYATNTIVVFIKSGDSYTCVGGYDTLTDAVNCVVNSKYNLPLDPNAEGVVYFRADVTTKSNVSGNLGYNVGTVIFDLGGHTLTQANSEPIFRGYSKYMNGVPDSHPDIYYLPGYYVIRNGGIVLDTDGLFYFGTDGSAYNNYTGPAPYEVKTLDWTLDGVNVSLARDATLTSLIGRYKEHTDHKVDKPTHFNLTIKENCVLDITYAPENFVLFDAFDPITDGMINSVSYNTDSIVNVEVGACDVIAANDEFILHKINPDNSSSVTYTEDASGNYLNLNIGGTEYNHEDLYTPYGYIDIDYIDVASYPVIEFSYSNGNYTCYKAYTNLGDALSGNGGARIRCRDEGTLAVVYLRDDVTLSAAISGNMGFICGTMVIDLGGNTITQTGSAPIFKAFAKYDGSRIGNSNFKLINGKIELTSHSLFYVGLEGTAYANDITHVKNVNWTLDNLTLTVGSGVTNVFTEYSEYGSNTNDGREMIFNLTINDNCVIDMRNAAAGALLFGANDPNIKNTAGTSTCYTDSKVNINVGACSILATSGNDPAWVSVNEDNGSSVTFTKNAKNEGTTVTVGDVTCTYESLSTRYGYVPLKYAAYPIAEFKLENGKYVFNKGYAYFNEISSVNGLCRSADAKAVICLREDIKTSNYTGSASYVSGNLCWNMGTVIIDLNGHTITQDAPNPILRAYAKHVSATVMSESGKFEIINGNIILNSYGIFDVGAEGSAYQSSTLDKTLYWTFDNINISFGKGATVNSLLQFTEKLKVARTMGMNVTIKENCVIDLENAPANFLLFNANETTSAYTESVVTFNVEGAKIIGGDNSFKWADVHASNGSSVAFVNSDNGYVQLELPGEAASLLDTSVVFKSSNGADLTLVKISEGEETTVYTLAPASIKSFVPKMSLTLDRNLIMNAYIPVNNLQKFTFDGIIYDNLASLADKKVTLDDGNDYYLITLSLDAKEAARTVKLTATVDIEGKSATATFTFSIPKYAEKLIASENGTEVTLIKDVLQYIRAAYAYFGTNDTEAISKINAILGDYSAKPTVEGDTAATAKGFKSVTFILDGTPSMRFYLADGKSASQYKFYIGEKQLGVEVSADGTYVDIDVYAYALCETVNVKVDGNDAGSFHINAYYAFVSGTGENSYTGADKEALTALTECFWKYLQSARAYRESVIEN
ncbi:MAG: metallophosphoesterase [Clostridia bacterium]|nr:metallophosphoesterase [Clostridia bacterium]